MQPFLTLRPSFFSTNFFGILCTCFVLLPPIADLEFFRIFSLKFISTFILPIWIVQMIYNIELNSFYFYDDKIVVKPYLSLLMDETTTRLENDDKLVLNFSGNRYRLWSILVESSKQEGKTKLGKNARSVVSAKNIKKVANILMTKYGDRFEFRGKHLLKKGLLD